jgi:hypothetical protein
MGCQTLSWKQASLSTICFGPGMTYLNLLESVCMMPNFPFPCECRPFGSATILGGYDRDGPQLYMIEPSGVAYVCTFSLSLILIVPLSFLFSHKCRGWTSYLFSDLSFGLSIILCNHSRVFLI